MKLVGHNAINFALKLFRKKLPVYRLTNDECSYIGFIKMDAKNNQKAKMPRSCTVEDLAIDEIEFSIELGPFSNLLKQESGEYIYIVHENTMVGRLITFRDVKHFDHLSDQ